MWEQPWLLYFRTTAVIQQCFEALQTVLGAVSWFCWAEWSCKVTIFCKFLLQTNNPCACCLQKVPPTHSSISCTIVNNCEQTLPGRKWQTWTSAGTIFFTFQPASGIRHPSQQQAMLHVAVSPAELRWTWGPCFDNLGCFKTGEPGNDSIVSQRCSHGPCSWHVKTIGLTPCMNHCHSIMVSLSATHYAEKGLRGPQNLAPSSPQLNMQMLQVQVPITVLPLAS